MNEGKIVLMVVCGSLAALVIGVAAVFHFTQDHSVAQTTVVATSSPHAVQASATKLPATPAIATQPRGDNAEILALKAENDRLRQQMQDQAAQAKPQGAVAQAQTYSISGSVWLIRETGASDLLRGLQISVIAPITSKAPVQESLRLCANDWQDDIKFQSDEETEARKNIAIFADNPDMKDFYKKEVADYDSEIQKDKDHIAKIQVASASLPDKLGVLTAYQTVKDYDRFSLPNIAALVRAGLISTVDTDADGKYKIDGLKTGAYILHARLDTKVVYIEWLVPFVVKDLDQSVNLSNNNAITIHNTSSP